MAPRFPELQDAGWLRRKYELEGLSPYAIAVELGCRPNTVSRALRRHGITARMGLGPGLRPADGARRAPRANPRRPCLSMPVRLRARDSGAGGRAPTGKDPLLRLPARRRKAERPHPAAESAQRRTLRSPRRPARGRADSPRDPRMYSCRCDCGNTTKVRGANLTSGHTRSCGCLLEEYRLRELVGNTVLLPGNPSERDLLRAPGHLRFDLLLELDQVLGPRARCPKRGGRRPPASPSAREPTSRRRRPPPAARSEPPCTRQRCSSRRRALLSRASARRPRRRTLPRRDRRSAWQRRRTRCRPSSLPPLDRHAIGVQPTGRAQGTFANAGPRRRSGPTT
jgi:hypothetical protein